MLSTDTSTATGVITSSTQTITLGFYFMANTDLVVTRTRAGVITTLTLDSDYSVTGANNESGGSITVTGQASGDVITIVRTVPYTQLVDLVPLTKLSETLLERALDKLTMLCQQLKRSVDASGLLPTRIASTALGVDGAGNWIQRSASELFTFLKTYGGFFGTTSGTVAAGDHNHAGVYATAAQGALADTAVQPASLAAQTFSAAALTNPHAASISPRRVGDYAVNTTSLEIWQAQSATVAATSWSVVSRGYYGGVVLTDAHTFNYNGFFSCLSTAANVPEATENWLFIQCNSNLGTTGASLLGIGLTTGQLRYQLKSASVWGAWTDKVTPVEISKLAGIGATTVKAQLAAKAPLASPALTGTPTAPTAAAGTNTTQIATTAILQAELDDLIPFSPILSKTGDGTGVATLTVTLSAPTTVRLDGRGYFYTDSGGTTGETQKKRLAAGANTLYIKVKKSSAVLTFLQGQRMTRFDSWSAGTNAPSISGNLADLPSGLTYFSVGGYNTISGSLADLPSGLTYFAVYGNNTISGSLADLPSGVTYVGIAGYNTISGSLADLPSGVTYVVIAGNNTISGSLADLPSGVTYVVIYGNNTVSGSLADLPSGVTTVVIYGNNTVSGSLADLPSGVTYVGIAGNNTCTYNTASGSRTWASGMRYVYCRSVGATSLTSAMIDAILIDLSAQATWSNERSVSIKGTRTSASDAAVSTLTGYGVVVTVTA